MNDVEFREYVRQPLGQSDEQLIQRAADEAEGKREQRFAEATSEQKTAAFIAGFEKNAVALLEETQKNAER